MLTKLADDFTDVLVSALVLEHDDHLAKLQGLLRRLATFEQRQIVLSTVALLSKRFLPAYSSNTNTHNQTRLAGASAALLTSLLSASDPSVARHLGDYISKGPALNTHLATALITALPFDERTRILESTWTTFLDKLYIKHAPLGAQESMLRILLLHAYATVREDKMQVFVLAHSSVHTAGISNRLGAPSERARTLGMYLGTLVSRMVDDPKTRMSFDFDETDAKGLESFAVLGEREFVVGEVAALRKANAGAGAVVPLRPRSSQPASKPQATESISTAKPSKAPAPKISIIEEIPSSASNHASDDDDEDDDLPRYTKPDSDPSEDETSDPSLTPNRPSTRPKPPVYILDLINQLRSPSDSDSAPEAQTLALQSASSLITRKATFGTELSDNALALATALADLRDDSLAVTLPDWAAHRGRAMAALLAACPETVGPWAAMHVFEGDLSAAGRAALLGAVGMAGRALAGYGSAGRSTEGVEGATTSGFPSKTLPARLHALYLGEAERAAFPGVASGGDESGAASRMGMATTTTTSSTSKAQSVAKSNTNANGAAKKKKLQMRRTLAHQIGPSLFHPLGAQVSANLSRRTGALDKHVLPVLLHTLALLVSYASPGTASTSAGPAGMATELWLLALALRARCSTSGPAREALLFALLAALAGLQGDRRRLVVERGRELLETRAWVDAVLEGMDAGGTVGGEEQRERELAMGVAGVCGEIVEEYNRLLLGDLVGFS